MNKIKSYKELLEEQRQQAIDDNSLSRLHEVEQRIQAYNEELEYHANMTDRLDRYKENLQEMLASEDLSLTEKAKIEQRLKMIL